MDKENRIQLFENKKIRTAWDEENETWYFSIVDVIAVLTGSSQPRRYWSDLKIKLKNEGNQTYDKIVQLKMTAADGKKRMTDVANTEELLRIIQSIPSPKAEPFKMWLARVGSERIDETIDPELTIDRALELVLNMLAEATTTELSKTIEPKNFDENREVSIKGGSIAGNARKEIENTTGKPVLTEKSAVDFTRVIADIIDEKDNKK